MLRKIYGTNFFHIKFLGRKHQMLNGPVLPPSEVFYFNGQALLYCTKHRKIYKKSNKAKETKKRPYYVLRSSIAPRLVRLACDRGS
jgi:hypothetical protein